MDVGGGIKTARWKGGKGGARRRDLTFFLGGNRGQINLFREKGETLKCKGF